VGEGIDPGLGGGIKTRPDRASERGVCLQRDAAQRFDFIVESLIPQPGGRVRIQG